MIHLNGQTDFIHKLGELSITPKSLKVLVGSQKEGSTFVRVIIGTTIGGPTSGRGILRTTSSTKFAVPC